MKEFARRIAVVVGAVAVSIGLLTVTAPAAQADTSWKPTSPGNGTSLRDTSWTP